MEDLSEFPLRGPTREWRAEHAEWRRPVDAQ